jgi:hypothetical protein
LKLTRVPNFYFLFYDHRWIYVLIPLGFFDSLDSERPLV